MFRTIFGVLRHGRIKSKRLRDKSRKVFFRHFASLIGFCLFLAVWGCGEERIENVLYDIVIPPAEVQTELPPEVWETVKRVGIKSAWGDSIFKDPKQLEAVTTELEAYYNRYIDAGGIAIIGNEAVADKYFLRCRDAVMILTAKHPYLRDRLQTKSKLVLPEYNYTSGFYMVIYPFTAGKEYFLSRPPEVLKFYGYSRAVFYSGACPGSAITSLFPYASSYCHASIKLSSTHAGPGIETFVHEFGHMLHRSISFYDPEFRDKLIRAYTTAVELGTWKGAYAEESHAEYWAEGVVFWYLRIGAPDWHRHYRIFALESYEAFAAHDPLLFELLDEWLPRYSLALFDFQSFDQHLRNPNWR